MTRRSPSLSPERPAVALRPRGRCDGVPSRSPESRTTPIALAAVVIDIRWDRVERRQGPGGELGRTAALGELDQGVQVDATVARQLSSQGGGEAGRREALAAPGHDLSGQQIPLMCGALAHASLVSAEQRSLTARARLRPPGISAAPIAYRTIAPDHEGGSEPGNDPWPASSTMSFSGLDAGCQVGRWRVPDLVVSFGRPPPTEVPSSLLGGSAPVACGLVMTLSSRVAGCAARPAVRSPHAALAWVDGRPLRFGVGLHGS